MKRKASTHRLDEPLDAALDQLSKILRTPKNRLINEAVRSFVQQRGLEVEQELETTLKNLRSFREADPDFERSIANVVQAEVEGCNDDPLDGTAEGQQGAVQSQIRELFHA